jgi:hypothetical protein
LYLIGKPFKLITDNRAVQLIFSNPKSNPPRVIQRWAIRMRWFNYVIEHRPGRFNTADYLSRNPLPHKVSDEYNREAREYLNFVTDHAVPKNMTREEIAKATAEDKVLQILKVSIQKNTDSKDPLVTKYLQFKAELSVNEDGVILRGHRILIPESLQQKVLNIAHEGHQGIRRTKELLRTKVWFVGIDRMVERLIADCEACCLSNPKSEVPPLQMSELPSKPWQKLSCDFYGPLPNGHQYLVIMDDFSRFPVVEEVSSTASKFVIPALDRVFSEFGIPEVLKSDNGPPFNGGEIAQLAQYLVFREQKITPELPRANGTAERFAKILK